MATHDITTYGAVGDNTTNNAAMIQAAIDKCASEGGGTVLVPAPGKFRSGSFQLKSNVELHVERGAAILSSDKDADMHGWPGFETRCRMFIWAKGAENIAITGGGEIDGCGRLFMAEQGRYIHKGRPQRPHTVVLHTCRNVTVRDVTLRDGANWSLRMIGCEDVVVSGIRILNDLKVPNCDGIDPDHCRNVRISDCFIQAGDDGICIKARQEFPEFGPCENITVTGCTIISTSCALMVGIEASAVMRNIVFDSCVIQSSNRGLGVHLSHGCNVESVIFSNMIVETRYFFEDWWGAAEPIYVVALPEYPGGPIGKIRGVTFSNIRARSENGIFVAGSPDKCTVEDIVFDNIQLHIDKWSKWEGGRHDRRPLDKGWNAGLTAHRTSGVFIDNARDVTLRNVRVTWGDDLPMTYAHCLEAHNAPGLRLENLIGDAAHPGTDPAQLIE